MGRWVIFDCCGEILGRVYSRLDKAMAERMARTVFPDTDLSLKEWSHASIKERKEAKRKMLVRSETCTRLWSNPPKEDNALVARRGVD